MNIYKRYWFEFDIRNNIEYPWWVVSHYGITAFNYADAINILKNKIFIGVDMPEIKKCIENVDIRDLDQNHVIPNMKPPIYRGIWFPMGFD